MQGIAAKLSSRKMWLTMVTFIGAILVFLNASKLGTQQMIAVLSSFSVLIVYIIGESISDAKNKKAKIPHEEEVIDWKKKFTSRKFWAAIISFVTSLLIALGIPDITIEQIGAMITALSSVAIYILSEGSIDAAKLADEAPVTNEVLEESLAELGFDEQTIITSTSNIEEVSEHVGARG